MSNTYLATVLNNRLQHQGEDVISYVAITLLYCRLTLYVYTVLTLQSISIPLAYTSITNDHKGMNNIILFQ